MQITSKPTSNISMFGRLLRSSALSRSVAIASLAATGIASSPAYAVDDFEVPMGGQVVGGAAAISNPSIGLLNVHQSSDRVVINWDSFNIGGKATTEFFQPGTGSLAVNRVVGDHADPTQILGTLKANGRVMVLDRNGVAFGPNSRIDVGGIIASTGDVDTAAVMSGANRFDLTNFGDAAVENFGDITVADGGLAALVAPSVRNNGTINAKLGKVALASGDRVTVDLYGDNLIEMALDSKASKAVINQTGTINAEGGTVQLATSAAKDVVDNVINLNGVTNAGSATMVGGKIILSASGNAKVNGKVKVDGGRAVLVAAGKMTVGSDADISALNGGFVETSGADIKFEDGAKVRATSWLIDPTNMLIDNAFATTLEGSLSVVGADVVINTPNAGVDAGNIDVEASVDWSTNAKLSLFAHNDINIKEGGAFNATGTGSLVLDADGDINLTGTTLAAAVSLSGGNVTFNTTDININDKRWVDAGGGNVVFNNTGALVAAADTIRTSGLGTISVNQNFGGAGTIQGAVNAIQNTGANFNTINVGAGNWGEFVNITEPKFQLNGAMASVAANDASVRTNAANESIVNGFYLSGADYVVIDGFTMEGNYNSHYGVQAEGNYYVQILNNIIQNFGTNGIYAKTQSFFTADGNRISTIGGDGIHNQDFYVSTITDNLIDTTGGDGIHVEQGTYSTIERNDVHNAGSWIGGAPWDFKEFTPGDEDSFGADGIFVKSVNAYNGDNSVYIADNTVETTRDDGIEVYYSGRTKIANNEVYDAGGSADSYEDVPEGADGISVRHTYGGYYNGGYEELTLLSESGPYYNTDNFDVAVLNNVIEETLDDGIDVVGVTGNVMVAGNDVLVTGLGVGGESLFFSVGDQYGGDSIHIGDVYGFSIYNNGAPAEGSAETGYDYEGFQVVVLDNNVAVTQDDGIEVENVYGKVLVANNDVTLTGIYDEGYYGGYYGGYYADPSNGYGGDGIHIRDIDDAYYSVDVSPYGYESFVTTDLAEGGTGYGYYDYGIVVLDNTVAVTDDDGIEVQDTDNRVLVANNNVSGAGYTNILLENFGIYHRYSYDDIYGDSNGADGIVVHNVEYNPYDYNNYAVQLVEGDAPADYADYDIVVLNNHIAPTILSVGDIFGEMSEEPLELPVPMGALDDGIEVSNSDAGVLIDGNAIDVVGYDPTEDDEDVDYYGYTVYGDYYGADGIFTRNLEPTYYGDYLVGKYAEPEGPVEYGNDYAGPFRNIKITHNTVSNTADDGIESIYSYGRILVRNNDVQNAGVEGNYYSSIYPYADYYGADGVHIRDFYGYGGYYGPVMLSRTEGAEPALPYYFDIEVLDNTVTNTDDDGIEVLETYNASILVDNNDVEETGGDGIVINDVSLYNYWPSYDVIALVEDYEDEDNLDYPYYGGEYNIVVSNNNVDEAGEDGIEVGGYEGYALIDDNDVTGDPGNNGIFVWNSGYYGDYDSYDYDGYWGGYYGTTYADITDNYVADAGQNGIWAAGVNYTYIDNNEVYNSDDDGILVTRTLYGDCRGECEFEPKQKVVLVDSYYDESWFQTVITNNQSIGNEDAGIHTDMINYVEVGDNNVANNDVGVYIGGPLYGYNYIHGNTATNNDIGMLFESGMIDMTGASNVLTGGQIGYRFEPIVVGWEYPEYEGYYSISEYEGSPIWSDVDLYDNTIGTSVFSGQSQYFVELLNTALFDPGLPTLENGWNATYTTPFGVVNPTDGLVSAPVYDFLEEMFWHYNDDNTVGLFFFRKGEETPENPTFDESDVFDNQFDPFNPGGSGAGFTITGLPNLPGGGNPPPTGGFNLADIEPAAGGNDEDEDAANIEPAAGGDTACWGDAVIKAGQGQSANYDFNTTAEDAVADTAACANRPE